MRTHNEATDRRRHERATIATQPTHQHVISTFGTTKNGIIVRANAQAAALVNVGVRGVQGRDLLAFFNGDRARVRAEMASAAAGEACDFEASLRPRDRKPVSVRVNLAAPLDGHPADLEWIIET